MMDADTFINIVLARVEKPDEPGVSLGDRLRKSNDSDQGTWDGILVSEMTEVIEEIINQTSEDDIRCAWNEIAEMEGCEPLQKGDILGGPYSDMFVDEVLNAISGLG